MSHKQVLQLVIAVILVISFLVGCGGTAPTAVSEAPAATSAPEQAAATPTPIPPTSTPEPPIDTPTPEPPTATPTPEPPTPTPTPLPQPKAGHWEGGDEANVSFDFTEAFVSFDITAEGDIQNFELDTKLCTLSLDKITVEADGTFNFTESATVVESGEVMQEAISIRGVFDSATNMTGTLVLRVCQDKEIISILHGEKVVPTWSLKAEWKGLTEAPLPTEEPDEVLPSEHSEAPVELISEHDGG